MKIKNLYILAFSLLFFSIPRHSQILTPTTLKGFITTGTPQVMTGAQNLMGAHSSGVIALQPIGFHFTLLGKTYDSVSIRSDGFFRLGAITALQPVQDIASDTNVPIIAALWANQTTSINGGFISTLTSGVAPYCKFTVEWYAETGPAKLNTRPQFLKPQTGYNLIMDLKAP